MLGCPGTDGCDAMAVGGNGGDVPRWGVRIRGNVFGAASLNLGMAEGGRGGDADAQAGDGGDGEPCCDAGNGANCDASGGVGGDAHYTDGGSVATGGGAKAGDGGDAIAFGGDGGDGGDCYKAPGGDGGDGGNALSAGGDPGTTTGDAPQVPGNEGAASSFGGNGGDGGDGFPVGLHGRAGMAVAAGTPAIETDGLAGTDGAEWPTGGFVVWCIDIRDLLPNGEAGPIPPGHSGDCTLVDMGTMEPVGQVPFQFFGPADTMTGDILPTSELGLLQFINPPESFNPCGLIIDLRVLELSGPVGPLMGAEILISFAEPIQISPNPLGVLNFNDPPNPPFGSIEIPAVPLEEGPLPLNLELDPPVESAQMQLVVSPNGHVEIIEYIYIFDP